MSTTASTSLARPLSVPTRIERDQRRNPSMPNVLPEKREKRAARGASRTAQRPLYGKAVKEDQAVAGFGLGGGRQLQADTPSALQALLSFAQKLDSRGVQGPDQLHQRIDIASDDAIAGLHPLNGRHRQGAKFGELALVQAQKSPGCPQLRRRYHVLTSLIAMQEIIYRIINTYDGIISFDIDV